MFSLSPSSFSSPPQISATEVAVLSAVLSIAAIFTKMLFFPSRSHFPIAGLTAIVTGGSQGLGLSLATQLAQKGANVVIVAQNEEKLRRAVATISQSAMNESQKFLSLSYDLRSPDSAPAILSRVTEWNSGSPPDLVFLCAGNSLPSFFADAQISTLREQMDTIYWSAAYMAHATLNLWKQPARDKSSPNSKPTRHLIFTSSAVQCFPIAGYAPYTPCKAAMRALSDTLNQEVQVYNGARLSKSHEAPEADIKIHTILPMGILTPGFENENKIKPELTMHFEKDDQPQTPEEVARISLNRLAAGDYIISTVLVGHLMKGVGMAGSVRSNLGDILWSWLAYFVILFVTPDFMGKAKAWGKEKGMHTGTAQKP